jgi:O-antigen ligase
LTTELLTLNPIGILVGLCLGVFLAFVVLAVSATYSNSNRANLVGKSILWGQALTICLLWPARELPGDTSFVRRSAIRFELGWLVTTTMCIVLMLVTWRSRRETSTVAKVFMLGVFGVAATQLLSSIIADDQLPISACAPMIFIGIGLALFPLTFDEATRSLTQVTALLCGVSIASMFFARDWAMPISEARTLPGPFGNLSLGGVLQHPNLLALIASFGVASTLAMKQRTRLPFVVLFLATIWLTDSRTQIVTSLLVILIWGFHELIVRFNRTHVLIGTGVVSAMIVVAVSFVLVVTNWRMDSRHFGLARRPELWSKAIEYWKSSKFVGVGSAAFDDYYRVESGNRGAVGAHNQLLQSLASEGILGVIPVLLVFCLVVYAFVRAHASVRLSFGLVGVVGLTMFAVETPLQLQLHRAGHVFLYISIFVVLVTASTAMNSPGSSSLEDQT